MIPSDLSARLRMLSEASFIDNEPPVQGATRTREIQARLPQLLPGQQFTAHITRALSNNTFQAIVGGREYTLALNHAAKSGDTLDLVVTRQTANALFARPITGAGDPSASNQTSPFATRANLSATGRLISFLLGGQTPASNTRLDAGRPLLNAPPTDNGAELAPTLRQALSRSGLFYESHLAQWLSGSIKSAALRAEPQGRETPLPRADQPTVARQTSSPNTSSARAETASERPLEVIQTAAGRTAPVVAERLMPLVHQQLDVMATQQYVLYGQAWPGQHFEWELDDPDDQNGEGEEGPEQGWNSALRLTMPQLGEVEARLHFNPAGIAIRLLTTDANTTASLNAARDRLDAALSAAGIKLTGFVAEEQDDA